MAGAAEPPGTSRVTTAAIPSAVGIQFNAAHLPGALLVHEQRITSGPIPSSGELAALKAVDPAALELVYAMADRQQRHDHAVELATLQSETGYRRLGIFSAVFVMSLMIGSGIVALIYGYPTTAAIIISAAGLTSIASVFIRGRDVATAGVEQRSDEPTHAPPPPATPAVPQPPRHS